MMTAPRKRRITEAKITHISLVPRGANRMPVIFKADDQTLDLEMLVKADIEKGELTAIVYAPESRDTQGDIASAAVIKDMMYDAARDGVEIDVRHDGVALAKNQAFVAESFIVQKDDPRFDGIKTYEGQQVDPTGSWGIVLKVDDPALRQKFRDGEWNGVSMGGTAVVESEKADDMTERVVNAMAKALGITDTEDIDMTPQELTDALAKSNESLAKSLLDGIKTVITELVPKKAAAHINDGDKKPATDDDDDKKKKKKKAKQTAPAFKGDMTDPDDILTHQRRIALWDLRKDVDWSDSDEVAEYGEALAAFKEEFGDLTDDDKATVSGKAKKVVSNQSVGKADDGDDNECHFEGVSKEDADLAKIGAEMAKWSNEQRGLATAAA